MSKRSRPWSLVFALACLSSGRAAAVDPPKPSEAGARAAARYVAETGSDLASLDSHFHKYREAAEKLSALYANLAAKAAEVGRAGGRSQSQLLEATKQVQETQKSFIPQYLQLEGQMRHEARSYVAISNIMKTKHDTVKNSISNVR